MLATTQETLPLSTAQEGMWFAHQLDPSQSRYNWGSYAQVAGPLDVKTLARAIRHVAANVEALNVAFVESHSGTPQQVLRPPGDLQVETLDFSAEVDPRASAVSWIRSDLERSVDLTHSPLFHSAVLRLDSDLYLWYWRVHHIVMDGYGMALVINRICDTYRAMRGSLALPSDQLGSLSGVLREDAAYRRSARYERDRDFWRRRMADGDWTEGHFAAWTCSRQPVVVTRLAEVRAATPVDSSIADGLRAVATGMGVTLPRLALAATALYLGHFAEGGHLTLSVPFHGRATPLLKQTPCFVSNVLPFRVAGAPAMPLQRFVVAVAAEMQRVVAHHRYRGEHIWREFRRGTSRPGHFGPLVNFISRRYRLDLGGPTAVLSDPVIPQIENLAVAIAERTGRRDLALFVQADAQMIGQDVAQGHADRLREVLRRVASARPDTPLGDLSKHM